MSEVSAEVINESVFIEGIESWNIGLFESPDMSVSKNLGVQNVWIVKHEIEDEEKLSL